MNLSGFLPAGSQFFRATTVAGLVGLDQPLDVVLLDVHLADGSVPEDNVRALRGHGWHVLLYTGELRPLMLARCVRAGALGIFGKHREDWAELARAVIDVADGQEHQNADLATAMEADLHDVHLAPREAELLALYATGLPMKSVARRLGIAPETAKEYLSRVRRKYHDAGRAAPSKTDLYIRAVEDGRLPRPETGV